MKSRWAFHGVEGTRQQRHTSALAPWWALYSCIDELQGAEGGRLEYVFVCFRIVSLTLVRVSELFP